MNQVVIDENASSQLGSVSQPVKLLDHKGKLLGHFVPALSLNPSASCPYSGEQLETLRDESGGRQLHEIWGALADK